MHPIPNERGRAFTHFLNPRFVSAPPRPPPREKTPPRFWQWQRCWQQSRTHRWWSGSLGCDVAPACRGIYGRTECLWCCRSLLWLLPREAWAVAERKGGFLMCRLSCASLFGVKQPLVLPSPTYRPCQPHLSGAIDNLCCYGDHRLLMQLCNWHRQRFTFSVGILFMPRLFVWYLLVTLVYGVIDGQFSFYRWEISLPVSFCRSSQSISEWSSSE